MSATFDKIYTETSYIISADSRPIVTLKDKKESRQFIANNNQKTHIIVFRVDEGILKDGERCDFALCLRDLKVLYFIELKGGDFPKALSQIRSTINSLVVKPAIDVSKVEARIVLSKVRVPKIKSTEEVKLDKLLKQLNGRLRKESQRMVESL